MKGIGRGANRPGEWEPVPLDSAQHGGATNSSLIVPPNLARGSLVLGESESTNTQPRLFAPILNVFWRLEKWLEHCSHVLTKEGKNTTVRRTRESLNTDQHDQHDQHDTTSKERTGEPLASFNDPSGRRGRDREPTTSPPPIRSLDSPFLVLRQGGRWKKGEEGRKRERTDEKEEHDTNGHIQQPRPARSTGT